MIGKMAITTALRRLNDLEHLVTLLFFPETDFIYNDLHIVQKWTKTELGKLKNFKISVHGTSNLAILWLQGAWNYGR